MRQTSENPEAAGTLPILLCCLQRLTLQNLVELYRIDERKIDRNVEEKTPKIQHLYFVFLFQLQ